MKGFSRAANMYQQRLQPCDNRDCNRVSTETLKLLVCDHREFLDNGHIMCWEQPTLCDAVICLVSKPATGSILQTVIRGSCAAAPTVDVLMFSLLVYAHQKGEQGELHGFKILL